MSYYENMFSRSGNYNLKINTVGEIVLTDLESKNESSFVTGDFMEIFQKPFEHKEINVVLMRAYITPGLFNCLKWNDVCKLLNSKSTNRTKILFGEYYYEAKNIIEKYIVNNSCDKWITTNAGISYDENILN